MNKILFSWLATANDFNKDGSINKSGPNVNIQAYYWEYSRHIIFYTPNYQDKALQLFNYLQKTFKNNRTNIIEIDVKNVYTDLASIKNKVEAKILEFSKYELHFLLSAGTGLMKITWYIIHSTLKLNTKLLLILSPADSKDYLQPDLHFIEVEQSATPLTAIIRETNLQQNKKAKEFITTSLKQIYNDAFRIAQADNVSVLILGNTGTGKEVLANYIHSNSARKHKPFISVNCSAFSDQLLESQLFGHKKGSFTGAYSDYKGVFEQAKGGTVFLDEIGDISSYMQQLLLRFLQQKEIQPIGGKVKNVDVRVIAATNKKIKNLISGDQFRNDLFYRLGITLTLPDFKNYLADEKLLWFNHFLEIKKTEFRKNNAILLDDNIKSFLLSYNFAGNIRELMNIIDNLYIFSDELATLNNLPQYLLVDNNQSATLKLADVEKNHIKKVLKMYGNNKSKAAKALGIALNTLKNKLD